MSDDVAIFAAFSDTLGGVPVRARGAAMTSDERAAYFAKLDGLVCSNRLCAFKWNGSDHSWACTREVGHRGYHVAHYFGKDATSIYGDDSFWDFHDRERAPAVLMTCTGALLCAECLDYAVALLEK